MHDLRHPNTGVGDIDLEMATFGMEEDRVVSGISISRTV